MSHFVSTEASTTQCRCGTPLLVGLDEGLTARVDAQPLQPGQEIAALIDGKWTYTYAGKHLIHRDAARIRTNEPAGTIHAQHKCPKGR